MRFESRESASDELYGSVEDVIMRAEPFAQPGSRRAVVLPTSGEDGTDWRKLTHAQRAEPHITVSLWRDTAQHERRPVLRKPWHSDSCAGPGISVRVL